MQFQFKGAPDRWEIFDLKLHCIENNKITSVSITILALAELVKKVIKSQHCVRRISSSRSLQQRHLIT